MSERSFVGALARSVLPEQVLVGHHEVQALAMKYAVRQKLLTIADIGVKLCERDSWPARAGNPKDFSPFKIIGNIAVDIDTPIQSTGYGRDEQIRIGPSGRHNYAQIHVGEIGGIHNILTDLSSAADYIKRHDQLSEKDYVVGVTYEELGSAATKLGFKEMDVIFTAPEARNHISVVHDAFLAVNYKPPHRAKMAMVYLPTNDFLDRFAGA